MKMERMRNQIEVRSKIDGKMYKVNAISPDGTATAAEMLDDGSLGENTVTITEANCLAFRIVNDPAPVPVPEGYAVRDGILYKDDAPACEQGQLIFKDIIGKLPGALILTAESAMEDKVEMYIYTVKRDMFKLIAGDMPAGGIKLVGNYGDKAVLVYSKTAEETEKDDQGQDVTVEKFVAAGYITVAPRDSQIHVLPNPITMDDAFLAVSPDNDVVELMMPSDEEVDGGVVKERKNRAWLRIRNGEEIGYIVTDGKLTANWSLAYHQFVFRTEDEIWIDPNHGAPNGFTMKNPKLKETAGYDILIDVTKGEYKYTLTFSNADYEFKTLVSKSTRDRGYIVSVE